MICFPCRTLLRLRSLTAQKIREVRDSLEIPIVVENVSSYAEFHVSEMTEWEFLNEVVERADCGILLDVNNIYVSSQNHNFDPYTYVDSVPAERVAQIHIAGHSKFRNIFWIRTIIPCSIRSGNFTHARLNEWPHRNIAGMGRQHSDI